MNAVAQFAFGRPTSDESLALPRVAARPATTLFARVALATIFIVAGVSKFADMGGSIAYGQSAGLPWPAFAVPLGAVVEVVGGVSILFGLLTRIGALALALFLAVAGFYFHDFWNLAGAERQMQMIQFLKNLAIFGGMLLLIAYGAGRYSFDRFIRERMTRERTT
ncbi:MAG: DoxX family protein [Enhygromyxa sp.]